MLNVSGQQSTKTGFNPRRIIDDMQEMIVNVGNIISSPAFSSRAAIARSIAKLPLHTETP